MRTCAMQQAARGMWLRPAGERASLQQRRAQLPRRAYLDGSVEGPAEQLVGPFPECQGANRVLVPGETLWRSQTASQH